MHHRNYGNPMDYGMTIIVLLILFLSYLVITPIPSGVSDGTGDYPAPSQGDWVIENDTYVSNESVTVHGNINVTNNATLTLENVDLLINSSSSDVKEIYVNWGAAMNILNSTLSAAPGFFSFEVNGLMIVDHSNISRTTGGILIKNNSVVISNSTIYQNFDNALVCFGNPIITNNFIHSNFNGAGILTNYYSAPYIYNNTIRFNEWGIKFSAVGFSTIVGNEISNNIFDGIKVELGYLLIMNNSIHSNGEFGIRTDHAFVNVSNNSIFDNGRWGIYSLGAHIIQRDNYFKRDGKGNGDGDVILEWEIDLKTFDHNNESLNNVNLSIHNENNELVWNGTTVGSIRNLVIRDYEIIDNGTELIHTYTVNASWGYFYNVTEFDLSGAQFSIYAAKTVHINIDIREVEDSEEGESYKRSTPAWFYPVVSMIWLVVIIVLIVGLAFRLKKRQY